MTYTPIQLEAIKIFGRKDLTEGCILTATVNENHSEYIVSAYGKFNHTNIAVIKRDFICSFSHWADIQTGMIRFDNGDIPFEILGHIPHLEDLFRVAIEKGFFVSFALQSRGEYVLSIYGSDTQNSYTYTPILPLLDQPSLPEIVKLFS